MRILLLPCLLALAACSTDPATARPDPNGALAIGTVQGRGERSPLADREVVVAGTVTARLDGGDGGWFLQDAGDGDGATSDGVFVASGGERVAVGERVRVRGRVQERDAGDGQTLTTLEPVAITPLGPGALPPAVALAAPPDGWERFEGMRVRITAPLTVSGTHAATRHGELLASFDGRLFTPTEVAAPGAAAHQVAADNARRRLLLDDGYGDERPPWYLGDAGIPRTGAVMAAAEGVLDQRHGHYRLQLTAPIAPRAARPAPPQVGGDVRIASFNLENLFNGDGRGGGFPTPRGARTPAELQAQLAKLVATIRALDPDIAALMELENDGYGPDASIATLVAALGHDWRAVDAGQGPGGDEIRVGLLYRPSRVTTVGRPATLVDGPFAALSRAPLAQAFRAGRGPVFVVAANHFKSKGCGGATGADLDQGDGQACWNASRTAAARRLDAWLDADPTATGGELAVIVGDLNAYAMEDPVRALLAAGWRDAFAVAGVAAPYSYVYDGQAGRLDHALLSPALARRLAGAREWHGNADEPETQGYRAGGTGPWRSSDHDPLLLGFRLRNGD